MTFSTAVGGDLPELWHRTRPLRFEVFGGPEGPSILHHINMILMTMFTGAALAWLLYRVWQVFSKPLPELIETLGLEVPIAPKVSLAGIKADSVTLHWTRSENQGSVVKYFIQINGINVGESSRLETAITVTGLKPDHFYTVRVVAINSSNFQAASPALRLKTYGPDEQSLYGRRLSAPRVEHDQVTGAHRDGAEETSSVSSPIRLVGSTLSTSLANVSAREHVGGSTSGKRSPGNRKQSHAINSTDSIGSPHQVHNENIEPEIAEVGKSVEQLTEVLNATRQETEETRRVAVKEEEEWDSSRAALLQERDHLKLSLKERDDASAELRKEVASLDRQNRAAQSRKAAKEKILQQKLEERRRMKEDIARWNDEIEEMDIEIEQMRTRKDEYVTASQQKSDQVRVQMTEEQLVVKAMEEEIRSRGVQLKELEEERKQMQEDPDDDETKARHKLEEEDDVRWEMRLRDLQATYAKGMQALQQARENHRQAQERLAWWHARGITGPVPNAMTGSSQFSTFSATGMEHPSPTPHLKHRKSRQRQSRTSTVSSSNGFSISEPRAAAHPSPHFLSALPAVPFFNMGNGTATASGSDHAQLTQSDIDQLTGGAPMSPTANSLLPSNLLGDEDALDARFGSLSGSMQAAGAFEGESFPRLGRPPLENLSRLPQSPVSSRGSSASFFSSPRESLNNLSMYPSAPGSHVDSDRRSARSTSGSFGQAGPATNSAAASSSKRFGALFNLNLSRQRGKTTSNEPPPLGSLKTGQSSSFPVDLEQPSEGLDPIGTKRRRGSHSASWVGPMASLNFLNRNAPSAATTNEGNSPAPSRHQASRRKPFNMFSSRYDPLEPSRVLGEPSSPRPSSIASADKALPRPSTDSQPFGWPAADMLGHRSSPLGADWSVRSGDPWASAGPSRRGSVKHTSMSSLPRPITASTNDEYPHVLSRHVSPTSSAVPAGESSTRPSTPKLNPAAPTFKTIFSRSDTKKAEKAEREAERAEKAAEREREKELEWLREDSSPEESRHSRDNRSVMTQDSQAESRGSLDRPHSATASESTTPSASGARDKESIFQKISRKSSSGKFNISWKDKGGLFSKKAADSTTGELDEDVTAESPLGKSVDSTTGSPSIGGMGGRSSISWGTLRRKSKKGDKSASEASEKASETGDDE
ncbi:MAG: hypothetical protein M1817_000324 [Caeruleum heppii]|nr:MAG: hypothetical protein M1817_000324 [Caeruleum heppii]